VRLPSRSIQSCSGSLFLDSREKSPRKHQSMPTPFQSALTNARTMRLFAQKIEQSRFTATGSEEPFTLGLWDSWDAAAQRAFMTQFLIDWWDQMTPEQQQDEISQMPPVCHRCGSAEGGALSPDAGVGYTKLFCSNCALQGLLGSDDASAGDRASGTRPSGVTRVATNGTAMTAGQKVCIHGVQSRPELNGKLGTVESVDARRGRCGVRLDGELISLKQSCLEREDVPP